MTAIPVKILPAAKGRWIRTPDAAILMRKVLGAGRDWDSWLKEDRRERNEGYDCVTCYSDGENVFYDSADILDLIAGIQAKRINLRHRRHKAKIARPKVHRVKVSGEIKVKVVTNGQSLDRGDLRELIFQLKREYDSMPVASHV